MNFIMIGLLLREALDRLCVRLNMYLVSVSHSFAFVHTYIYAFGLLLAFTAITLAMINDDRN